VRIDLLDQDLLGGGSDDLLANGASLEEKKGWDTGNPVLLRELLFLVHVDFDDLDLVGQFPRDFIQQRGNHLAGAAPFGPKIDQDQFVGLQHFALKIESTYGGSMRTHYGELIRYRRDS
jgi:hypothetical protein